MKKKQSEIDTKTYICKNCKERHTFSLLDLSNLTFGCIAFLHLFCPKCYEILKIEEILKKII